MTRVGLVLGAGGVVGQAYHVGVLTALEDLGWDPRSADLIVGTSAGSVTAASLRAGLSASDQAAFACGDALSPHGEAFFDTVSHAGDGLPGPEGVDLLRGWRLPRGALIARALRRPGSLRAAAVASTLAPAGQFDLRERTAVLDELLPEWPSGLWVCAARRDHGRRVVFGREGSPPALVSEGVAASCAIPAYFAPVAIGTREYLDGGVHSPTNADVMSREPLDVVVVSSPMSAAHGSSRQPDAGLRWSAHRRLDREVRRLRASGTRVLRFEPTEACLGEMGLNAMAEDRSASVVESAHAEVMAHARSAPLAGRLATLLESDTHTAA